MKSSLLVQGITTMNGGSVIATASPSPAGPLVTGATLLNGRLTVQGGSTRNGGVTVNGDSAVAGNSTIAGTLQAGNGLSVTGGINANKGAITNLASWLGSTSNAATVGDVRSLLAGVVSPSTGNLALGLVAGASGLQAVAVGSAAAASGGAAFAGGNQARASGAQATVPGGSAVASKAICLALGTGSLEGYDGAALARPDRWDGLLPLHPDPGAPAAAAGAGPALCAVRAERHWLAELLPPDSDGEPRRPVPRARAVGPPAAAAAGR
ncbi:hypothetical protein [Dankookia sp. P2]|uniref:hypothetical protein n=1 Tax=Dankookia sp. P2 TaxID=3423955 RepID=UPI003D66C4CD